MASSARLHHLLSSCHGPTALTSLQLLHGATSTTWGSRRSLLSVAITHLHLRAVCATDPARQPFNHRSGAVEEEEEEKDRHPRLKIVVVGFGNHSQFLARTLVRQGHTVVPHSRSDYSAVVASLGASFFTDPHDLCECQPDVIILTTSILSVEVVLRSLPVHRFRRNTLFVDVLSVKEFPKNLLPSCLLENFDIICTHPMFGPESARDGWGGLPFVFDKVRVDGCPARRTCTEALLDIFVREGCRMVEMPCTEHDAHATETQFLTQTVGRTLATLELKPTPIDAKGYEMLLRLVDNTYSDSFDLYNGLFMYNNNSTYLLHRLKGVMESVKRRLFDGLHDVLRRQLFGGSPPSRSGSYVDRRRASSVVVGGSARWRWTSSGCRERHTEGFWSSKTSFLGRRRPEVTGLAAADLDRR